jgi:hypothetical protein
MGEWILPEVKAENEAIRQAQKQRAQEKKDEEFFREALSPRYVLIDAALWDNDVDDIFFGDVAFYSLYRGSAGEQLWNVAPYLVDLHSNANFIDLINKKDPVKRRVTWLHSSLNLADLRKHLRRFLRMKTEPGMSVYFRFYDPYVANTVFPNLTKEQINEFFGKIEYVITENAKMNPDLKN